MNTRSAAGRASAQNEKSEPRRSNRRKDPVQRATSPAKNIVNQPVPEPVGVLLNDPVARRNPPPQARDDISIPSIPLKPDDETEFYDDYDYLQPEDFGEEEPENVHSPVEKLQLGPAITIAQQRILELSVPDLARAADSLFECFQGNEADDVFNGILAIKRRAFQAIREEYDALDQSNSAPFIDFAHFVDATPTQNQSVRVTQIARTNVVTAYDMLYGRKNGEASDIFPFLECLNRVLPTFFTPADNMFQNPQSTLHLRTWLFVEDLSHNKDERDFRELLVYYFCKDKEILMGLNRSGHKVEGRLPSYPQLFSGGYFKDLGGEEGIDHDVDDLCSARIAQIKKIIDDNKEDGGISQLRKHFPLHNLVEDLLGCFESLYKVLAYEESVRAGTEPSQHGQQEAAYSQGNDYGSESQSIVRVGSQEAEPSLFAGPKSIQALRGGSRATSTVPPSNQQLAGFRSGVPRDYHEHSNADLLNGSPFPPASSYRLATEGRGGRERGQKRPRLSEDDEDEEDEEESFETDTRRVDPARRDELQRQMPPPPRPQPVPRRPQRRVSESSFSSGPTHPFSMEQSSQDMGLRSASQAPLSSRPFNAIAKAASQRKKEVRMADPERQGPRQRVPWSEHDSQVLLDLIQEYGVRWSSIETMSERFEYPRNQQAYRDRARNLKTDILMIDMLLPPNFDGVALSNKEIAKIKGVGKNPFRKEADVDDNNNPINTELAESTPF
ncbi:hypothetical protein F52700_10677 [Fusarium sp. NRRL 52700]|nr:hypothetical protein F52700_10677 [Fusarium sp. NRRL 52700]